MERKEVIISLPELIHHPGFGWRSASQVELLQREVDQIDTHQLFLKRLSQYQPGLVERPAQDTRDVITGKKILRQIGSFFSYALEPRNTGYRN
jgi:hypothetical protein